MHIRNTFLQPFFIAFMVIFMIFIWILFAPEPFGGQASYVMIAGASMEPGMHAGDLAIVRKAQVYHVGDVVTYQHPVAGPIIHRIIDQEGDRYVFQGDNNDWIDSYCPSRDEFIGKLWLHLPKMGQVLQKIRSPHWLILSSILIGAGIFSSFAREEAKERPRSNHSRKTPRKRSPSPLASGVEGILFVLAALAFAAGILALVSFSHPTTVIDNREVPYQMLGEFQYSAQAPSGIYDGERIESGDPIYLQLTDQFDVFFQFHVSSELFSQVDGSIRLDAALSDPGGWTRILSLHPAVSLSEEAPRIEGMVSLAELLSIIESLEEQTGFERPYYTLEIVPSVTMKATYNGNEILDHFEPRLTFHMEEFQLYLIATEPNTSRLAQLEPQQTGNIQHAVEVQNTISILGMDLPVKAGRWISGIGLGIASLGLIGLAVFYVRATKNGEAARIAVRYGSMLVDIKEGDFVNGHHRVEVNGIEDLARFAERMDGVILHEKREYSHHYYVQGGQVTYHYQTPIETPGTTRPGNHPEGGMGESDDESSSAEGEYAEVSGARVQDENVIREDEVNRGWRVLPARLVRKAKITFDSLKAKAAARRKDKGGTDEDA